MRSIIGMLGALCCAVALAAAAQDQRPPSVAGAWARATPPGVDTGAVYLTVTNGAAPDALVGARSSAARAVELHGHFDKNGVLEMRKLERQPLAAGQTLELAPLGLHLMLLGLAAPLVPGRDIAVTLVFERAGAVEVTVPVIDARAAPPTGHGQHDHR
jgi:hypothetical protein